MHVYTRAQIGTSLYSQFTVWDNGVSFFKFYFKVKWSVYKTNLIQIKLRISFWLYDNFEHFTEKKLVSDQCSVSVNPEGRRTHAYILPVYDLQTSKASSMAPVHLINLTNDVYNDVLVHSTMFA